MTYTPGESQIVTHSALHRNVLAALVIEWDGRYAAYVFPVPGMNHDNEVGAWEREGLRQPKAFAKAVFGHACEMLEAEGHVGR